MLEDSDRKMNVVDLCSVLHSEGCQTWWLKGTEMYSLTVLESRSPKLRCQQGHTPSRGSREESFLASLSF